VGGGERQGWGGRIVVVGVDVVVVVGGIGQSNV
jgi:hypothetical protein